MDSSRTRPMPEDRNDADSPEAWLLDGRGGARRLDREALGRWHPEEGALWARLDEDSERVPRPHAPKSAFSLIRSWVGRRRLITMSDAELPEVVDVVRRLEAGNGPTDVAGLLLFVIESLAGSSIPS